MSIGIHENRIDRRSFLRTALACGFAATALAASQQPPNIILILADDLGYGDLNCYGNERIKSPNIDRLAAGGTRFTDFHSSGPVCSPTRAGLLTGRYQQRCGITEVIAAAGPRTTGLEPGEVTFAYRLKLAGYATGIFGKWHLGYLPRFNPDKHGFDRFLGYVSGNVDYFSHSDSSGYADWWENSKQITEDGYTTDLITKHTVRFIEDHKKGPFCVYVPYETVHAPYQGPNDRSFRTVNAKNAKNEPPWTPGKYAEMIERMDQGIGEILAATRRLGIERNTFVFFFSDNGATNKGSNGPLRGFKGSLWEGGHREPAIAYWPGGFRPDDRATKSRSVSTCFPRWSRLPA